MSEATFDTLNGVDISTERSEEFHFRFVIGSGWSKRTLYARNADEARHACGIDVEKQRREGMAKQSPTNKQHSYLLRLGVSQENAQYMINNFSCLDVYDAVSEIVNAQQELADEMTAGLIASDEAGKILHSSPPDEGGAVNETSPTCDVPTKSGSPCRNKAGKCQFHS